MINLILKNHYSQILGLSVEKFKELDTLLSYTVAGVYWSPLYRTGRWDGKKHLLTAKKGMFKTGLLYRVLRWLQVEQLEYEIEDLRDIKDGYNWDLFNQEFVYGDIKLRDVQQEAIKNFIEPKLGVSLHRGILAMPPRSGKTLTAGVLASVINKYPVMFIVHKIDLAYQTQKVFKKIFKKDIGIVGDGNFNIKSDIVITTIQSLCMAYKIKAKFDEKEKGLKDYGAFREFINSVKVTFIDECHIAASDIFQELPKVLENSSYIVGLSGTPYREDGDDLLIEQLCGPVVYELTRDRAMELGYILPMTVYFINVPPLKPSAYDWQTQKTEVLNLNFYIEDAVVNLVKRLKKKGLSSVVIVKERKQGDILAKKLNCDYLNGSVDGKKREEVYDMLNRKRIMTIVSTVTDIGVDIPTLDCVIIAGISKSKVAAFQRIRCNTPLEGKKQGRMFIFTPSIINQLDSRGKLKHKDYLLAFTKKLRNIYKKEKWITIREINYKDL